MKALTREDLLKLPLRERQHRIEHIITKIYDEVYYTAKNGGTEYIYDCVGVSMEANDDSRCPIPTMEEIVSELKKYLIDCKITAEMTTIVISWE